MRKFFAGRFSRGGAWYCSGVHDALVSFFGSCHER
jgi:hypothetical protein